MQNLEAQLSSCDKEPIHIIGGIQPHGCFIAFNVTGKIMHASKNAGEYLAKSDQRVVGRRLGDFFTEAQTKLMLKTAADTAKLPHYLRFENVGSTNQGFEILIYDIDGLAAAEFEPVRTPKEEMESQSNLQMRTKDYIGELSSQTDLAEAARVTCRAVRAITGFDRVMCYRFHPNWEGEVIAEDKIADAQSFLGHFFPASDIPAQARALYFTNRTRLIADSSKSAVPIGPPMHALTGNPLDLSNSKLRAVSLMHLEYLKNMRVVSSGSIAIINNGQLWGLIACHGSQPNFLTYEARLTCEAVTSAFALVAFLLETNSKQKAVIEFENKIKSLFSDLRLKNNPLDALFKSSDHALHAFRATGMAYVSKTRVDIAGLTPTVEQIREIASTSAITMQTKRQSVMAARSLAHIDPKLEGISQIACGVLAVSAPELDDSVLMFFRPELLSTVVWGGNPRSVDKSRNYDGPINPRKSFESWSETVRKNSMAWENYEISGAEYLKELVFDALVKKDILIQELGKQLTAARP